jgi:hypothetical protein
MTRHASGLVLLLSLWCAGLRAEDALSPKPGPQWRFPIYHDPAETGDHVDPAPVSDQLTQAYDPVTRPWTLPLAKLLDSDAPPRPEAQRLQDGQEDWISQALLLPPGRSLRKQTEGPLGSVTAEVAWRDPHEAPALDSPWKTDQAWRLPVVGPLFVFGQFGAAPDPVTTDELTLKGKTGVGCKLPVPFGIEVQVRGGPSVTHSDPLCQGGGAERSELFVELQARCPLPCQLGLEYLGSAVPALTPLERDRISQDLGLALPVGDAGRLRLGAKHQWESTPTPKPWRDGMQLYVGFELGGGTSKQ